MAWFNVFYIIHEKCQDIPKNLSRHFIKFIKTFHSICQDIFLLPQQMFFLRQNTDGKLIHFVLYNCCFKMFSKTVKLRFIGDGFVTLQKTNHLPMQGQA